MSMISSNLRAATLLSLPSALLVLLGAVTGGALGATIGLALALLAVLIAYGLADRVVLGMAKAREIATAAAPELHHQVGRVAALVGLPAPRLFVIDSPIANAFAGGRNPSHA